MPLAAAGHWKVPLASLVLYTVNIIPSWRLDKKSQLVATDGGRAADSEGNAAARQRTVMRHEHEAGPEAVGTSHHRVEFPAPFANDPAGDSHLRRDEFEVKHRLVHRSPPFGRSQTGCSSCLRAIHTHQRSKSAMSLRIPA
jgi:hypothetical protein